MRVGAIGGSVLAAALILALLGGTADGARAQSAPRVLGVSAIPVGAPSIPVYWIGKALGYYAQEGIDGDMDALPGGNVPQGVQMVVNHRADLVIQLFEGAVMPTSQGHDPGLIYIYDVYQHATFRMLVPAGSAIKTVADLKGKVIGIPAVGLPVEPLLKEFIAPSGLAPADLQTLNVGVEAAAAEALKNGRIAALFTASVTEGQYKGAGYDFVELPPPPAFSDLTGAAAAVRRDAIADPAERDRLIRYLRVWAKSTAFAVANPAAAIKLDYQVFPAMKPHNATDAEAIRQGVVALKIGAQDWGVKRDGKWGRFDPQAPEKIAAYLGVKLADPGALLTNDLIDQINDFDEAAVIKQAKEFK